MSYFSKERFDSGFPRLSGISRPVDRNLTVLEDEIERLVNNRSAPPSTGSPSGLGGSYGKNAAQNRKLMQDLHDKVTLYQRELEKKDKLIQDLSKSEFNEPFRRNVSFDLYPTPDIKGDLTMLQLKNDKLHNELKEAKSEILKYELRLNDLQSDNERYKEENVRQTSMIHSLRFRLEELQGSTRGEHTVSALQQNTKDLQDRILELESRIRVLSSEREDAEQKTQSWQHKFAEITFQLQKTMSIDEEEPENLLDKIKEVLQENLTLRGKISTMTESLESAETEAKASRETIQRLVSEIEREQKTYLSNVTEVEKMKLERNAAVKEKEDMQAEMDFIKGRLEASENVWASKKRELDEHNNRVSSLNEDVKQSKLEAHVAKSELKSFKESLAVILSNSIVVDPSTDDIMETVRKLAINRRENEAHLEGVEAQIKDLTEQLQSQSKLYQAALERAKRVEIEYADNKSRVHLLEEGISTSDAMRDAMKQEKKKYMAFLQKLANIMGVDTIVHDLGFDMNGETLLARAEQLMKREGDVVTDKTTTVYTLQRKLKTLKQQLESKDLHLDLMRKKIVALEEGMSGRSHLQKEKDDYEWSYKKLMKENDRLRGELGDARKIITEMKANLMDVSNVKLENYSQKSEIDELVQKVEKLEKVKEKQSRKLAGMKQELEYTNHEATENVHKAEHSMSTLMDELRTTKELLLEVQRRERQLTDFRQVIARMLGLDVSTLAIPDYEIISRLEKIIQAHHSHTITTIGLEQSLSNMEHGFRQGYQEASSYLAPPSKTKVHTISPSRKKVVHPQVY